MFDVAGQRRRVADHLDDLGFAPRDADVTDFASEGTDLRFKLGTARSEITIQALREHLGLVGVYRSIGETQTSKMIEWINDQVFQVMEP